MTQKTRIFLVDDDPIFRLLTKKIISNIPVDTEVIEFTDGQSALHYAEQHMDCPSLLPDTILLDLSMPILDGWGFLREYEILLPFIRKVPKLYILSSSMSPIDVERAARIPIVKDYLVKPLNKQQLAELITTDSRSGYSLANPLDAARQHAIINSSPLFTATQVRA